MPSYLNLSRSPNEKLILEDGSALLLQSKPSLTTDVYANAVKAGYDEHVDARRGVAKGSVEVHHARQTNPRTR